MSSPFCVFAYRRIVMVFLECGMSGNEISVLTRITMQNKEFFKGVALCGLRGCKKRPAPFPGRMSYKATESGLICLSCRSMFLLCCCLLGPLFMYCLFSLVCVLLLVVLVKLLVHAKWLARKTPLRKPNCGEGIISIKPRPKRAYDCVGLLYSFVVLLHDVCVLPGPMWYISYFYRMT